VDYKCDFCGKKCDGKIVIVNNMFKKIDGSNINLCNVCFMHYTNEDYDKIKFVRSK
jgi:ribosome-binding protein aMBF1 (putative translation factor)